MFQRHEVLRAVDGQTRSSSLETSDSEWMAVSAKAGTTAERHTCEAAGSDRLNSARSSEARVRRILFSLDKDLHGRRQPKVGNSGEECSAVSGNSRLVSP